MSLQMTVKRKKKIMMNKRQSKKIQKRTTMRK